MAEGMDFKMSESTLKKQAADLKAELSVAYPRVTVVRDLLDDITSDVGARQSRLHKSIRMHDTGLMEQLVALLLA